MTTILCLRGLDVKAGTEDIRTFFKCSRIPDGGVYIVGGLFREAFIAFTTERDAQLAMCLSGKTLKGSKVTLHASSLEELEKRLKSLLKKKKPSSTMVSVTRPQTPPLSDLQPPPKPPDPEPSASPQDPRLFKRLRSPSPITSDPQPSAVIDSGTAFLLGVCTVLGLQYTHQEANKALVQSVEEICSNEMKPQHTLCPKSGYVRLFGLPQSATKELICHFFKGLEVQEVIVNARLGLSIGCLVKFACEEDASKALLFNQLLLNSNPVEVRTASEKMWTDTLHKCLDAGTGGEDHKYNKCPFKETNCEPNTAVVRKRKCDKQMKHDFPKKQRLAGDSVASLPKQEYVVVVKYLPKTITKTEIKELLGCPNVAHKNILHLLDREGQRTDTAFVLFNCLEDYEYAINLTGCHVGNNVIHVSSTTKLRVKDMMANAHLEHSSKTSLSD